MTLLLAFTGTVAADHLYATGQSENRINLFIPVCFDGTTDLYYEADTGFFVSHGYITDGPWKDYEPTWKRAYASKATKFELSIDGEVQKSALHMGMERVNGDNLLLKIFVIEIHDGLPADDYDFVGRWYYDSGDPLIGGEWGVPFLLLECAYTVHFTT